VPRQIEPDTAFGLREPILRRTAPRDRTAPPVKISMTFQGTSRFVLERTLGSGGFGIVYAARDVDKDTPVALKHLQNVTPESLYRFKREFRSLADVSHPNLVQLYELGSNGPDWFTCCKLSVVEKLNACTVPFAWRQASARSAAHVPRNALGPSTSPR
jgi:hypothetical protein